MINYKKAGFDSLNNMFDGMLKFQEEKNQEGFIKLCSQLTLNQKLAFIDYSKGHEVFAGAMKDLALELGGAFKVSTHYIDSIKMELNKVGLLVTDEETNECCPSISFTDGKLIEGKVNLFNKNVELRAVDAKERIYNKSISYLTVEDLLESIEHFQHDIMETFEEQPSIVVEESAKKTADFDSRDAVLRELELFIENNPTLYYKSIDPIIKNLARKNKRGVYDATLATKLWEYAVKEGINLYNQEFGEGSIKLNPQERMQVAESIKEYFDESVDYATTQMLNKTESVSELRSDIGLDKIATEYEDTDDTTEESNHTFKSKKGMKNYIYKNIKIDGFFEDDDWSNVHNVFDSIERLGYKVEVSAMDNDKYQHGYGTTTKDKVWNVKVIDEESKMELSGYLQASDASAQGDEPFSRYDISFVLW